jgi:DNA-binding transcriptional regulator/RsmH inhibitor MraZ
LAQIPYFDFLQEVLDMSNVKHRRKYETFDCMIWKKTRVDSQGRVTLPQKLRKKLGLNGHSSILWISVNLKEGKDNEFLIYCGVKR